MRSIKDWNDVQFVLAVAEEGSFHAAAQHLRTHQSTVSRHIQSLERELGTQLFVRHSRGMVPTAAGRALASKAAEMEAVAQELCTNLTGLDTQLSGMIRVYTTEGIGALWLVPALADFQSTYPQIDVEIVTDIKPGNILWDEIDLAISVQKPTDPRVVAAQIGVTQFEMVASSRYIERKGTPRSIDDFVNHHFVSTPLFETDVAFSPWTNILLNCGGAHFSTKNINLYFSAINSGIGIGLCWSFFRSVYPDLIPIETKDNISTPLWMITHEETNKAAKIRALRAFLLAKIEQDRSKWFS